MMMLMHGQAGRQIPGKIGGSGRVCEVMARLFAANAKLRDVQPG